MEATQQIGNILQRYNERVGSNLLYSYQELESLNVDRSFIYALLEAFEDTTKFNPESFNRFPLEIILDYIRRTHRYYLSKKLLEIEQSISILLGDYDGTHPLLAILREFYDHYQKHLVDHIRLEEAKLLPHIENLIKIKAGKSTLESASKYSVQSFVDSHTDTEEDISKVREAILQYAAPATNITPYRILVTQLQVFENDLSVHALIEDKVLIPRALELENEILGG